MNDEIVTLLKTHEYFHGISDEILAEVAEHIKFVRYETAACVQEANEVFRSVGFLVRGRIKAVVIDFEGTETLFKFVERGDQVGMISAALGDPVPIRFIAVEPCVVLWLDYEISLDLTSKHKELRRHWSKNLAGMLRKTLLGDVKVKRTQRLAIIHESPASHGLVKQIVDRLWQLGEKICVFSDNADFPRPDDVPFRSLVEDGRRMTENEMRQQMAKWPSVDRVVMEVNVGIDFDWLSRLVEASDRVLWCVGEEDKETVAETLKDLESNVPTWRDKISIVWCLSDTHLSPVLPGKKQLAVREFTIASVRPEPRFGSTIANGLERLVHFLRGVQVGLALGGGAARGMAHLGVLKTLEENGIVVDMIAGTSAGAMTGVLYGAGIDADYLADRFTEDLKPGWFFRWLRGGGYWYLMYNYRMGRFDPMLRKYILDWKLEQLPIPCSAVTVDLVSGKAMVRDQGDAVDAILSSINLPVLSNPICRPGQALIDGGFLNNVPADVLVSKGCNFVIAVDVLAKIPERVGKIKRDSPAGAETPSMLETILRTYTVQSYNMNAIGAAPADISIEPDVSNFDMADFTRAVEMATIGKAKTKETLPRLKTLLHRLDDQLFPK
ncbi:MAG: patatin-like phospholipase family protein [Gemmataceae bacterium]